MSTKRLVSAFFFLFCVLNGAAQTGHEWIRDSQPYFKISVAKEGIYRISSEALRQAGFTGSPDPASFQLFHRGTEQAILVEGDADGQFDDTDYIEFYGRANDGTLDATLYVNPSMQPHKYYNLFSDTTAYFLTYGVQTGKRINSVGGDPSGLTEETHHWCEKLLVPTDSYSAGIDHGNVHQTLFDQGEGWMGVNILQNEEASYVIEGITQAVPAAGKPSLDFLITGRGPMTHNVGLYAGGRFLTTLSFSGYESYHHTQALEWSDIAADGSIAITMKVTGVSGADRVSAGFIRIRFPQKIDMSGSEKIFFLSPNNGDKSYVTISNYPSDTRLFDLTNPAEVIRMQTTETTTLNAVIPSTSLPRKIMATNVFLSPKIKPVSFRQIHPASHDYIIITHPTLRKSALGYADPVKSYAAYRSSTAGGGFDTLIVNIDELYDQFNYGERSPRAIFQFMKFLASVKLPAYLFLIGKGLDVDYAYGRQTDLFPDYKDLVPSAGYPGADMAFSAGLAGTDHVPAVATGRLTAIRAEEVAFYLNKIKESEALAFTDLRRKNILHLSGGIEEAEPPYFRAIMEGFETVAEDLFLGGKVQAISKQSTDIKVINIAEEINSGLGLITFFGHSSPNTLDFDIGLVTDPVMGYNNKGKYPVLLMNGCDAGAFFLNTSIFGENWINTADKGAIGFIAHSAYGLVNSLRTYSSIFYEVAYGDSTFIKKGIGAVQREVARRYLETNGTNPEDISQAQQMVLLGDPALKLFGAQKPDYELQENSVSISAYNNEPITALTDSFRINIPVRNLGIAKAELFRIEVKRKLNDATEITYDTIIQSVLYSDTIQFNIQKSDNNGFGNNIFTIRVDADDLISELNESNNVLAYEFFIPLNSTKNLYPYNYSIVNTLQPDLSFQYTDLRSGPRSYLIEIDTANNFDSGFKKQFELTTRTFGKQSVELLPDDSLVYYWRTRIAQPLADESSEWTVHSFTYIKDGPEGWAQVHFPQFQKNENVGLVHDPVLRRLKFKETVSDLAIKTFSASSGMPQDSISFKINGAEFNILNQGGVCRNNTINLIAFDRKSTQPYPGLYFKWYELLYDKGGRWLLCGREPYVINSFKPDELSTGLQDDLIQYVDNIQTGDSVILFNIGNAGFAQWPADAKTKLEAFGISSAQLGDLQNGDAVVILGRKGSAPGEAQVFRGSSPGLAVKINKTITGRFNGGSMASVVIGPAQKWQQAIVKFDEIDPVDNFSFDIVGIQSNGTLDTIRTNLTSTEDLADVDPLQYPWLKMIFRASDDIDLTAVRLRKWFVIYEPVAEGLIFYDGPIAQQVLFEGETLSGDYGFLNISDKTFNDSLVVRYEVLNHLTPGNAPSSIKIKAPAPGDTTLFTVPFKTINKAGLNDVSVYVNPRIEQEKYFDNNVIMLTDHLKILTDKQPPVIDVTIDGRYIANNEFVPANPHISVRVWDENSFQLKKDTLGVNIFLSYPCATDECSFQRINFSREDVDWRPATAATDFMVNFTPVALAEGLYTLRVEAIDGSGNRSGEVPYELNFQVDNDPTVLTETPFPNPFALETTFQIVVTAESSEPYFYNLRLLTLSGELVHEISDTTVGLHVGRNQLSWNAQDAAGRNLPGGIYLYRLVIKSGSEELEQTGKVVLIR